MKSIRKFFPLILVQLLLTFLMAGCGGNGTNKDQQGLNVLFIVSDDMRMELGAYGYDHMHTPNIDKLASEGRLFINAHIQEAICNPSRMSFLTGMRPDIIGVYSNREHFRSAHPDISTIPQFFRERGYRTQAIGKIFHGGMDDPFAWSIPRYDSDSPVYGPEIQFSHDSAKAVLSEKGKLQRRYLELDSAGLPIRQIREPGIEFHSVSWEAPEVDPFYFRDGKNCLYALKTLDTLAKTGEPFFLGVGFHRPHTPYVAPADFFRLYELDSLDEHVRHAPKGAPGPAFPGEGELRSYTDVPEKGPISQAYQAEMRRAYRASVSYVDFLVGELLSSLEKTGLDKNTIVVLIGDHGYHLGEQEIWGKQTLFEWGTRAPLITRIPGQPEPGKAARTIVEFIDIFPTLAELAGFSGCTGISGSSFATAVCHPEATHKEQAFSQYPRSRDGKRLMGYSVRDVNMRYTLWIDRISGDVYADELYELGPGEHEQVNLSGEAGFADAITKYRSLLEDSNPGLKKLLNDDIN